MATAIMTNSITLGLTANYCKGWTVVQAIREILANALDTHTKPEIIWEAGVATVTDFGDGFHPNGLLIGETTKTTDDIGQYGEGLKVGAMVLLRNGSWIIAESLGKRYTFKMEDSVIGTQVLTIYMEECQTPSKGTVVRFACEHEQLMQAKELFLALSPKLAYQKDILDAKGCIYVQGLLTEKLESVFGYNLHSKGAMNRDRSILNRSVVTNEVSDLLSNLTSREAIQHYLVDCHYDMSGKLLESDITFNPCHPRSWKKMFFLIHGQKSCLADDNTSRAEYLGYTVVKYPWSVNHSLKRAGIPTSLTVTHKDESRSSKVTVTTAQRAVLAKAKAILQPVFAPDLTTKYTIRICKMKANGERDGKVIRINIDILDRLEKTLGVLFHELCHLVHGYSDCSSEFEADLTYYGGKLAMALLTNVKTTPKRVKKGVGTSSVPSVPSIPIEVAEEPENPEKADGGNAPEPLPIRQQIEREEREIARLTAQIHAKMGVNASREPEPTELKLVAKGELMYDKCHGIVFRSPDITLVNTVRNHIVKTLDKKLHWFLQSDCDTFLYVECWANEPDLLMDEIQRIAKDLNLEVAI
jgi:hypothetical protein